MAMSGNCTMLARVGAALGFLCGLIGLLAGLTQHSWKLGPIGWFTGGTLLAVLAVYMLVDDASAKQTPQSSK